jgi:hypothetical protein
MSDASSVATTLVAVTLGGMLLLASGCADPIDERLRRADRHLQAGAVSKATALARGVLDDAEGHWGARLMLARADVAQANWTDAEHRLATLEREARTLGEDRPPGLPEAGFTRARRISRQLYERWSRQLVPSEGSPRRTDDETIEILHTAYALATDPAQQDLHARQLAEVYLARTQQGSGAGGYGDAVRWAPPESELRARVVDAWKAAAREDFHRAWRGRRDVIRLATQAWTDGGEGTFQEVDSETERPPSWNGKSAPSEAWRATLTVPVDRDLEADSDAGAERARATARAHLIGRLRRMALAILQVPKDTDLNDFGRQQAVEALLRGVAARETTLKPGRAEVTAWLTRASLETMAFDVKWLLDTTVHGRTLAELAAPGCITGTWTLEVVRRGKPDLRETVQSAEACQRRRGQMRDSASFEVEQLMAECVCRVDS